MAFEYMGHIWRKGADPDFWKSVIRHPVKATKAAREQPEVRRAMLAYAKEHPECEATGLTPINVHHIKPCSVSPELAAEPSNFISLHKVVHMKLIGHPRSTKSYNPDVRKDAETMREWLSNVKDRAVVTKSFKWFEKQKAGN